MALQLRAVVALSEDQGSLSQGPHGGLQPAVTPVLGDLMMPSSGL